MEINLNNYTEPDTGSSALFAVVSDWSTETVRPQNLFVRVGLTRSGEQILAVVEITPAPTRIPGALPRLFRIAVGFGHSTRVLDRFDMIRSLQASICCQSRDLTLLSTKRISDYLMLTAIDTKGHSEHKQDRPRQLAHHMEERSWNLVRDPELLTLLHRRRSEIGKFFLLESTETGASFAKFIGNTVSAHTAGIDRPPMAFVQYTVGFLKGTSFPSVEMHVEKPTGIFLDEGAPTDQSDSAKSQRIFDRVRRRDQECSLALNSRTALLGLFDNDTTITQFAAQQHIERVLAYAKRQSKQLRVFASDFVQGNMLLEKMTGVFLVDSHDQVRALKLNDLSGKTLLSMPLGDWFLVHLSDDTTSIWHLPQLTQTPTGKGDSDGDGLGTHSSERPLSFFTFAISDLYNVRENGADIAHDTPKAVGQQICSGDNGDDPDDDDDDDSEEDHIGEYSVLECFVDQVEATHGLRFAHAAYHGLLGSEDCSNVSLSPNDLEHALLSCDFEEITSVVVSRELSIGTTATGSVLLDTISTFAAPIPGTNYLYFRRSSSEAQEKNPGDDDDDDDNESEDTDEEDNDTITGMSVDGSLDFSERELNRSQGRSRSQSPGPIQRSGSNGSESGSADSIQPMPYQPTGPAPTEMNLSPPLFMKFTLDDGDEVPLDDLVRITSSTKLTAYVSVFRHGGLNHMISEEHLEVARYVKARLDSYCAEQTLERLREMDTPFDKSFLRTVRGCMRKAQNVSTVFCEIEIYIAKVDRLVQASMAAGMEMEMTSCFQKFREHLETHHRHMAIPCGQEGYLLMKRGQTRTALPYWCFLTGMRSAGQAKIEVFHPEGRQAALEVMTSMKTFFLDVSRTTNQLLLLERWVQYHFGQNQLVMFVVYDGFDEMKTNRTMVLTFKRLFLRRGNTHFLLVPIVSMILGP